MLLSICVHQKEDVFILHVVVHMLIPVIPTEVDQGHTTSISY